MLLLALPPSLDMQEKARPTHGLRFPSYPSNKIKQASAHQNSSTAAGYVQPGVVFFGPMPA